MGKVASDKCHKWVFKDPSESESNVSNYWQSSFDAIPPEWTEQFASGIQTVAVIQAGYGLLQLGSCKIIPEDLHFVLRMRHTFESLGYQSGFYLSQLFSAARNGSASSSPTLSKPPMMTRPTPPPAFNWYPRHLHSAPISPNFSTAAGPSLPTTDETHLFLLPHRHESQIDEMVDDADIKWPNGLSFFNALTDRTVDNSKLLFVSDNNVGGLSEMDVSAQGNYKTMEHFVVGKNLGSSPNSSTTVGAGGGADDGRQTGRDSNGDASASSVAASDYLSLDCHGSNTADRFKKVGKFKRCFTMPARMASSSVDENHPRPGSDFRSPADAGIYSDIMETLLE